MKNRISLLLTAAAVAIGCHAAMAATKPPEPNMVKCIASARVWDITFKHQLATFMGEPLDRVPALVCQRLYDGFRTGRISFSDINAIQLDQPTQIWKVIKGNSRGSTPAPSRAPVEYRTCTGIDGTFQIPATRNCPLSGYAHDGY